MYVSVCLIYLFIYLVSYIFHCAMTKAVSSSCLDLSDSILTEMSSAKATLFKLPLHFLANSFLLVVYLNIALKLKERVGKMMKSK